MKNTIIIEQRKSDNDHLSYRWQRDISIALTQLDELIEKSEYISECDVVSHKKMDHFWFFKIVVITGNDICTYRLNVGHDKYNDYISIYEINNYK